MERRDPDGGAGDVPDAFAQTVAPTSPEPTPAEPDLATDATSAPSARPPSNVVAGSLAAKPALSGVEGSVKGGSVSRQLSESPTIAPGEADPSTGLRAGAADADTGPLPEVATDHYIADHEVARGGMGRIVAARDRRLGRAVAIKELIQVGGEAALRFRREALITARLQHPGIVPVYEAGRWPSGEPFYAMKLVAGRPLDKVIAEARTLPDRLALLPRILAATEAIAYAHSQRVIHRDLKPGNILIGEFGETVVIDWGLAKDLDAADIDDPSTALRAGSEMHASRIVRGASALSQRTRPARTTGPSPPASVEREPPAPPDSDSPTLTVAGSVMGTPAYMAPEQARGETVDARADVFSLGAMLYHLLAGVPPYEAKTATDVIAAAALGNVVPLVRRAPRAPADLLAIVAHAMQPEPADRYATAGDLAEELRRFLTGQLVGAHRYTAVERVRRFVRRHRAAVAISAVAAAGFVVGGTLAISRIVEARDRAEQQRQLANRHREAAEHLVDFMQSDLAARLGPIGRLDLLVPLGAQVKAYYDSLAGQPGGMLPADTDRMARALRTLANADEKSGNVDAAVETWLQVKERLGALVTAKPDDQGVFERRLLLALTDVDLGKAMHARGKVDASTQHYVEATRTLRELLVQQPNHRQALLAAGDAHDYLGDLLRNHGKVDESIEEYTAGRLVRDQVARGKDPSQDREAAYALSNSHLKLGSVHYARGESTQALAEYRACAKLRDALAELDPDNSVWRRGQVQIHDLLADLHRELGDLVAAVATYEKTLPIADALVRRDPANTEWRRFRGNLLSNLGFALMDKGDYAGALAQFGAALANHKDLVGRDPANANWQVDLSRIWLRSGDAHLSLGDFAAALAAIDEAATIRRKLVERDPKNDIWRRSLAWTYVKQAQVYSMRRARGDMDLMLAAHEKALGVRIELVAGAPSNASLKNELASSEISVGRSLTKVGDGVPPRARELIAKGIEHARALVAGDAVNMEWKETLLSGLFAQGQTATLEQDWVTARPALEEAIRIAQEVVAKSPDNAFWKGSLAEVLDALAEVDVAEGKRDAATAHRRAAFLAIDDVAKAGKLPAFRKGLYQRLRAYR